MKFGDRVKIKNGFYEGLVGTLRDYYHTSLYSNKNSIKYLVIINTETESISCWAEDKDLELLK